MTLRSEEKAFIHLQQHPSRHHAVHHRHLHRRLQWAGLQACIPLFWRWKTCRRWDGAAGGCLESGKPKAFPNPLSSTRCPFPPSLVASCLDAQESCFWNRRGFSSAGCGGRFLCAVSFVSMVRVLSFPVSFHLRRIRCWHIPD